MNTILLDLLAFGSVLSGILVITSKNPIISVLFLIAVFVNVACYLIVRHCVLFCFKNKVLVHWSYMYTATELGQGESPRLNIASPFEGGIRSTQNDRLDLRAVSSMVKAVLLEVYSLGASLTGRQHVCNRLSKANPYSGIRFRIMTGLKPGCANSLNVKNGQPKEDVGQNMRTMGLPKVENDYGNRRIIVPASPLLNSYSPMKMGTRGRILDYTIRRCSSEAENISTVKSNVANKLLKLANWCKDHPNEKVDTPIYRLMYDYRLYEVAYNKLKSRPGNMTPGINPTTLDGMSSEVINNMILKLKDESFRFSPGRRVQIPKPTGGLRPLTVASPRDKLVQEVMRMILEVIFEPTFADTSHGFRPGKSCHTALKEIKQKFGVASWYIEGDLSKCFDSINHNKLITIIEEKISDRRFTNLIRKALKAGYFEFRVFKHSLSGTPQGSIISPILCNIFMNKLDRSVESLKNEFDIGLRARNNPKWASLQHKKMKAHDVRDKLQLQKLMIATPSKDLFDNKFKRLVYVRYADDWIIGIRGSKEDCLNILGKVKEFLENELDLTLSSEKTKITNASRDKALFLGTSLFRARHQTFSKKRHGFTQRNGTEIRLVAPLDHISRKLTAAGFLNNTKPLPRFLWLANDKDTIITLYNAVFRGIVNYYSFAYNLGQLTAWTYFILKSSCTKLLAAKYKLKTQAKVFKKFGKNLKGTDKIGFTSTTFKINSWDFKTKEVDILQALYTDTLSAASLHGLVCSVCGSSYRVEMHHVRHLKDLNPKISHLDSLMAKRRRKQIPVCRKCHLKYHNSDISKDKTTKAS